MTKDFNKQGRNNDQSSFRNTSSRRYGAEGPARPRLNREMVDRAWENGAPRIHADYHPRTTGNAPRNNWRNNQNTTRSSGNSQQPSRGPRNQGAQQDTYGRNSYRRPGSHQENQQSRSHFGAPQRDNNYNPSRPRYGARDIEDQQSRPQSSYNQRNGGYQTDGYSQSHNRQRPERAPYGQQDNTNRRFNNRDGGYTESRGRYNDTNRQGNNERRQGPPARGNEQRPSRGNYNTNTSAYGQRPHGQPYRNDRNERNERRDTGGYQKPERFKGDYEQFTDEKRENRSYSHPRRNPNEGRNGPAARNNYQRREQSDERHMTHMPDGRVIKGSRPQQRKEARFWTGINDEAGQLIGNEPSEQRSERAPQRAEAQQPQVLPFRRPIASASDQADQSEQKAPQKPQRRRSASLERRTKVKKPASNGPRPSQRGFKWPTQ